MRLLAPAPQIPSVKFLIKVIIEIRVKRANKSQFLISWGSTFESVYEIVIKPCAPCLVMTTSTSDPLHYQFLRQLTSYFDARSSYDKRGTIATLFNGQDPTAGPGFLLVEATNFPTGSSKFIFSLGIIHFLSICGFKKDETCV